MKSYRVEWFVTGMNTHDGYLGNSGWSQMSFDDEDKARAFYNAQKGKKQLILIEYPVIGKEESITHV
jgi:hypothetical protein